MAFTPSERVTLMKENFMSLHNQGYTILQIAEKYGITRVSIYHYLAEIAKKNGVDRDSLLEKPNKTHKITKSGGNKAFVFDTNELQSLCDNTKNKINALITSIDNVVKGENENA